MALYRSPLTVTLWPSSFLKKYGPMIPPAHEAHQTDARPLSVAIPLLLSLDFPINDVAVVAEWYSNRIVAGFVASSSPVPSKTRHVGKRCTLNLLRAETSSRGVVVRRGAASSGVVHIT
ncbi:hypothetical protein TNCV_857591 [Trichonephila clavipes]|nr:hypothetical protein TNCV_857591 [Trichonephila clavipes]